MPKKKPKDSDNIVQEPAFTEFVGTVDLSNLPPKKRRMVETYRETRALFTPIYKVARACGITKTTHYQWLKDDVEYAAAITDAEEDVNDEAKQALIRKALAENDTASLIFYLKCRHPEFKQGQQFLLNTDKVEFNVKLSDIDGRNLTP